MKQQQLIETIRRIIKQTLKESHPGNDQWFDAFQEAVEMMDMSDSARRFVMKSLDHVDPMSDYGDMLPAEAAKAYVDDVIGEFRAQSKDEFMQENGPATAPSKPQERPGPAVAPGKPDTGKPKPRRPLGNPEVKPKPKATMKEADMLAKIIKRFKSAKQQPMQEGKNDKIKYHEKKVKFHQEQIKQLKSKKDK